MFKAEGDLETPAITLNGHPLKAMKSTRGKSDLTITLSSAALTETLQCGSNAFSQISGASATLTSLSLRVVP